jgi:hypothetical protein
MLKIIPLSDNSFHQKDIVLSDSSALPTEEEDLNLAQRVVQVPVF